MTAKAFLTNSTCENLFQTAVQGWFKTHVMKAQQLKC